ncbi:MAG: hypothetical protein ABFQ64_10715 [Campylobacterota bacterium]
MIEELYRVLEHDSDKVIVKFSSEDHPVFVAHFPQKPILPGFLLIDVISEILKDTVVKIVRSKFISHVLPNDSITYTIETNMKRRKITVSKDAKKVSEIIYESK